ncbi:hypothetical protein [Streptomyces lydicus]
MDADELLWKAYPRLLPDDVFPTDAADQLRYSWSVAQGLLVTLALDGPEL